MIKKVFLCIALIICSSMCFSQEPEITIKIHKPLHQRLLAIHNAVADTFLYPEIVSDSLPQKSRAFILDSITKNTSNNSERGNGEDQVPTIEFFEIVKSVESRSIFKETLSESLGIEEINYFTMPFYDWENDKPILVLAIAMDL